MRTSLRSHIQVHIELFDHIIQIRRILCPHELTRAATLNLNADIKLPRERAYMHISAYSGALTYPTVGIVVNYYL